MKANDLCPSPNIEAADLGGEDLTVTITGVEFRQVGQDKETKGTVLLEGFGTRGFVLNRTNLKRIIDHHGSETDDWTGKQITLYPSETDFGGRTVPCIRVRKK